MNDYSFDIVPNYTNPALIMAGVNLTWIFFVIWAVYGFAPVLLVALAINHLIDRLAARKGA